MEKNDELWMKYLASCGESSRKMLASYGFTLGFGAGSAAPMMGMIGLMAVSKQTGVFDFPALMNGNAPANPPAPEVNPVQTALVRLVTPWDSAQDKTDN